MLTIHTVKVYGLPHITPYYWNPYIILHTIVQKLYSSYSITIHTVNVCYRVTKTHRMPYFLQKSPRISGSFAKSDLQS